MTIRRLPEDFLVFERPTEAFLASLRPEPSAAATHAVYELTKTSRTTPEAATELAKALKIRPGAVSYAGLKDKHARTTQFFSAELSSMRGGGSGKDSPPPVVPPELTGRQWSGRLVGWSDHVLQASDIEGNRFEIVVRDLARETCSEMDRRAALLRDSDSTTESASLLFVNYFGAQRFGSARHKQGFIAPHLIRGEFEQALRLAIATPARKDAGRTRFFTRTAAAKWGDWKTLAAELPRCPERAPIEALAAGHDFRDAFATLPNFLQAMYVEAYQSHLWNRIARELAAELAQGPEQCLRSDDQFGEMLFPPADHIGESWRQLNLPVLGPNTQIVEPWSHAATSVLKDEGIAASDLRIPGLRRPFFGEAPRDFMARAQRFTLSPPRPDDLSPGRRRLCRTVAFELGRGSYATVVLRALGQ